MGGSAVAGDVRPVGLPRAARRPRRREPESRCCPRTPGRTRCRGRVVLLAGTRPRRSRRSARRSRAGCRCCAITSGGTLAARGRRAGHRRSSASPAASSLEPRSGTWRSRRSARWRQWGSCRRSPATSTRRSAELDRARRGARAGRADAPSNPAKAARRADRRRHPVDLGRRGHRCGRRDAVEDPDERERQGARVRGLDVRARSQRGRRVDPPVRRQRCTLVIALRHDGEHQELAARFPLSLRHRARRGGRRSKRSAATGTSAARAVDVARRHGRLRERVRGHPPGRRPDAGRGDRATEGGPRRGREVSVEGRPGPGDDLAATARPRSCVSAPTSCRARASCWARGSGRRSATRSTRRRASRSPTFPGSRRRACPGTRDDSCSGGSRACRWPRSSAGCHFYEGHGMDVPALAAARSRTRSAPTRWC